MCYSNRPRSPEYEWTCGVAASAVHAHCYFTCPDMTSTEVLVYFLHKRFQESLAKPVFALCGEERGTTVI